MHENREISCTSWSTDQDRSAEAINRTSHSALEVYLRQLGPSEFAPREAGVEWCYFHPRLIKISTKRGSLRNSAKSGQCLAAVKEGSPIA